MEILAHPQVVPARTVEIFQYQKKEPLHTSIASPRNERIRNVPVMDFIGQFVELRPTASGAVGLCPFHDDDRPSFGINKKGNYWHCFAGCGGGDIISFWMKWKNCDFQTAVKELEEVLYGTGNR